MSERPSNVNTNHGGTMTEAPAAAVAQAMQDIHDDFLVEEGCGEYGSTAIWGTPEEVTRTILSATYPHLRRAVIEELIAKAENPGRLDHPAAYRKATDARAALSFLRAELGGEG